MANKCIKSMLELGTPPCDIITNSSSLEHTCAFWNHECPGLFLECFILLTQTQVINTNFHYMLSIRKYRLKMIINHLDITSDQLLKVRILLVLIFPFINKTISTFPRMFFYTLIKTSMTFQFSTSFLSRIICPYKIEGLVIRSCHTLILWDLP